MPYVVLIFHLPYPCVECLISRARWPVSLSWHPFWWASKVERIYKWNILGTMTTPPVLHKPTLAMEKHDLEYKNIASNARCSITILVYRSVMFQSIWKVCSSNWTRNLPRYIGVKTKNDWNHQLVKVPISKSLENNPWNIPVIQFHFSKKKQKKNDVLDCREFDPSSSPFNAWANGAKQSPEPLETGHQGSRFQKRWLNTPRLDRFPETILSLMRDRF